MRNDTCHKPALNYYFKVETLGKDYSVIYTESSLFSNRKDPFYYRKTTKSLKNRYKLLTRQTSQITPLN